MNKEYSTSTQLPTFEALEERLLLSVNSDLLGVLGANPPATGAAASTTPTEIGFNGDTSAYQALGDATPTGASYMLTDHWGGMWSDAEKSPTNPNDDLMCWAAAASNILQWTGWGNVVGLTNADQVFQYYVNHWTDQGGLMQYGWEWWFDGTNPSAGWSGWSQVYAAGGDFYPAQNFSSLLHVQDSTSQALSAIDQDIHAGYGTTIGVQGPGGHAITVWGFNYNAANPSQYYGIWVSDSDDDKSSTTPPDRLRYYQVSLSGGRWYLQNFYGSNSWYIDTVQALGKSTVPVPVNTAPVISGLPDKTLTQNTSLTYTTDLWAYASDAETPDSGLAFSITGNTYPSCGVSIVGNRYININPATGWQGASDVTVTVSDGQLSGSDTFHVTVAGTYVDLTGAFGQVSIPNPTKSGDWEQVQVQVTNAGNTLASGWSTIELWASLDGNLLTGTDDYKLTETRPYVYLSPGQTGTYCAYFVAPGNVPAGTYDLIAVIDAKNDFAETNPGGETNNQAISADRYVMQDPDLKGTIGTVSLPAQPMAGTWGYAYINVQNTGTVQAYGFADIQLLITTQTPPAGTGPVQAVTRTLTTLSNQLVFLQPGQTGTYVACFTLPQDLPAGDYYLQAVVDSSNTIKETNETNNTAYGHDKYQVRAAFVDLTGSFGTLWLANPTKAGDYVLLQLQVTNGGNVLASNWSTLQVWASGDGNLTQGTDDFKLAETRPYIYLAAGQTGTYYLWFLVPGSIPAGAYNLLAVIDSANDIAETNPGGETNNQVVVAGRFVMQAPAHSTGLASAYVGPVTGGSAQPGAGVVTPQATQPVSANIPRHDAHAPAADVKPLAGVLSQSTGTPSASANAPAVSQRQLLRQNRDQQLFHWQNPVEWQDPALWG